MPIYVGDKKITKISVGSTPISLGKVGEETVFSQGGASSLYVSFTALNGSFNISFPATKHYEGSIYYSYDGSTWNEAQANTTLSSAPTVYLRGLGNHTLYLNNSRAFNITGSSGTRMKVSGNILSLFDFQQLSEGRTPVLKDYAMAYCLASNCISDVSELELPSVQLTPYIYSYMFSGARIETAPALPATIMATGCYNYMFNNCTSLVEPPELPAMDLAASCYTNMFFGCSSLTEPPALPATEMKEACYRGMFYQSGLTVAPRLPATAFRYQNCYREMFRLCTSLVEPPALPATTLSGYDYYDMFRGCTSLEKLPALPATALAYQCYFNMFYGCTSIAVNTAATGDVNNEYRIPYSGTGTTATQAMASMFYGTSGTMSTSPTINTTYYTDNDIVLPS